MSYSLLDDIANIRKFTRTTDSYFQVVSQIIAPWTADDPTVAAAVNQQTPSFRLILRKTVPIMLCIAWETFVDDLKVADPARYATHFPQGFEKYHNEDVREIFLLRNCIVHCGGKIDAGYMSLSLIKTFPVVGTAIDFTEVELDTQFKLFGDAYARILT